MGTNKSSFPGYNKRMKTGKMNPGKTGEFDTKVKNKTFTYESTEEASKKFMKKFPFNHVVLEDRKEVWIKGGYPGCRAVPKLMEKFYPDDAKLAKNEFIEELKKDPSVRDRLDHT